MMSFFAQSGLFAHMNLCSMVFCCRRPFLFNLTNDETESHDLCASNPTQCAAMKNLFDDYFAGVADSAQYESTCSVMPSV
eukprot:m.81885 g.81885  ORF g.81885 m.81885 type:complete len:80 (+) comp25463_c0_seq1:165-404(+)